MIKPFPVFLLFFISQLVFSQNGFKDWDKNYMLKDAETVIQNEVAYAKEVEKGNKEGNYYVAIEKFRFLAVFTGNERTVKPSVLNSMKRVFKIKSGSAEMLNGLVSKELEFTIGSTTIWMPIQNQIIEAFRKEVASGKQVLLYTLFTNEHEFKGGIINTFLISEFTTEWH